LPKKMGWKRDDMFWFTYDIKNCDQCALASIITLLMLIPFYYYHRKGHIDDDIARAFYKARAHEIAVKMVKWLGAEFRLVIGQIFSGVFPTSFLGTFYLILAKYYLEGEIYEEIMEFLGKEFAHEFKCGFKPNAQYGDDTFLGYLKKFFPFIIGEITKEEPLGKWSKRLRDLFGLIVKTEPPPEIFGMGEPYSRVPPEGGSPFLTRLVTKKSINGKFVSNEVVYQGPVFLKRSFVLLKSKTGESEILPWRHENDFFDRAAISANDLGLNMPKMASKYKGLMIDSCGTNYVAYDFCRHMYRCALTRIHAELTDETYIKYMSKMGFSQLGDEIIMNPGKLVNEFRWDETWRRTWAVLKGIDLYDDYGNVRSRVGEIVRECDLDEVGRRWEEACNNTTKWCDMD